MWKSISVSYPIGYSTVFSVFATAYVGVASKESVANVVSYNTTGAVLMNGDTDTNYPYIFWFAIGA